MSSASLALVPEQSLSSRKWLHSIFSFRNAIAALFIVLSVATLRGRFNDPDMWWHLKTGQLICSTHHIPQIDLYSYTTNHHSYIPHEWLSQILIYAAYAANGLSGLMFWQCFFVAAILIAGFYLCTVYSGNYRVGFVTTLLIWLFGTVGFAVRPHLVGYLLLIFELIILHFGRTRNARLFYVLPPLFAVWVNCHGSFSFGIGVAVAYLISSLFAFEKGPLAALPWSSPSRRALGISIVLSLFALLLNPAGLELVLYPLKTMYLPSVSVSVVTEWQPLAFDQGRSFALLALLLLVAALPGNSRAKLYLHELFLLGMTTYLALSHARLLFPFGIIIAPIIARMVAEAWHDNTVEQQHTVANAALIAGSFVLAYAAFPGIALIKSQVQQSSPIGAVEYIKSHNLTGPMMNEWADGGYLIWALPEHPVFIDGRGDVYDWAGVTPQFARWATLAETPNLLLDKYGVQFCVLGKNSPMVAAVSLLAGWRRVYADDVSVVFQRNG